MIKSIDFETKTLKFAAKPKKDKRAKAETRILPNNISTRVGQEFQKTSSAFIDYPTKGLQGDINSNFYEFLTMGIVPYLAGSAMFMAVFNCVRNFLAAKGHQISASKGYKMGLGVIFYGLFKTLSKNFVTTPVKIATGVDTEMPYQNKVCNLPKSADENAEFNIVIQQRKVFDSNEFYRKDLLATGDYEGKEIPEDANKYELSKKYFDSIAKKVGLGENLNDSVTEVSPIIQNIVSTSGLAKNISSYLWAALGVCLATQDDWISFFESFSKREKYIPKENESFISKLGNKIKTFGKNTWKTTKEFCSTFVNSCKSLWTGKGQNKHAGKIFTIITAGTTAFLTANTIIRAKNMAKNNNKNTIDKTKESVVI